MFGLETIYFLQIIFTYESTALFDKSEIYPNNSPLNTNFTKMI